MLHAVVATFVLSRCRSINAATPNTHGFRSSQEWLPREPVITSLTGEELITNPSALPKQWDWRDVNGQSFVVADVMQHLPHYCGSCWIHGTVAALNDRIKVARRGAFPDAMLSRQALINCVPQADTGKLPGPGCDGGDAWMIYKYMHHNRIPDETCMPYEASNLACGNMCTNTAAHWMVRVGWSPATRFNIPGWLGYTVGDHGNISGEVSMMKEIFARGPITCNVGCNGNILLNYSDNAALHEGVYVDDFHPNDTDHVVEVAGWGETPSGLKYWVIRNSWGTFWGDRGWFKFRRGVNQMLIESDCYWAIPKFDDLTRATNGEIMGDYIQGYHPVKAASVNRAIIDAASVHTTQVSRWSLTNLQTIVLAIIAASLGSFATLGVQHYTSKRSRFHQQGLLG